MSTALTIIRVLKWLSTLALVVTAAAGGTGQFAVQLAKAAGNHVVATCGNARKVELLKRLGADRVVNYREEDLKAVLKAEYRKVRRGAHRSLPSWGDPSVRFRPLKSPRC